MGFTTHESKDGYRFGISVINFLGKVEWTQKHFMRKSLESTLEANAGDFYLRANEFMYVNMVMDSVTGTSFSQTSGDPLIYYEMYKVMPVDLGGNSSFSSQDSSLIILLSDGTFLYPSGGKYELIDLLGDQDSINTAITEYYALMDSSIDNSFSTRQPMYLRFGMSRRWEEQAIVAADLVTGFSNNYGSSSAWRASLGVEIIRFKGQFLRFGYAVGGVTKKSMSLGYGRKIGPLHLDIGMAFNGGFSIETAKGFDFAMGLTWQTGKTKKKD